MKAMFLSLLAATVFACGQRSANNGPAVAAALPEASVQDASGVVEFDTLVHDFGDVSVEDGPLTCSFTLTNKGKEAVAIFEVVSSCGCTGVTWTREPVQPGGTATITATYKNEDGPMPFDKTLTVYISGVKRPVILRLRGVVHEKKKSLSELYGAEKLGDFGLKTRHFKAGTLRQGHSVNESATVANLGSKPLEVHFAEVSPQLSVTVTPNPIPAGSTARLSFVIQADTSLYGRHTYSAVPVLNGRRAAQALDIFAFSQADFSSWSAAQREAGAIPVFATSTFDFGIVSPGTPVKAVFSCTNKGKSPFHIYQADTESPALQAATPLPDLGPGEQASYAFTLDTSALETGENVIMITLTTNSPLRPAVNLFVAGIIR